MIQQKNKDPEHLYHYTSVDVLYKLFMGIKDGNFIFQASSLDFMNDSAEYMVARGACEDYADEIIMEKALGLPFALCFSESEESIPLWSMYASRGKGICLEFNFGKLKRHFDNLRKEDLRTMIFSRCEYQPINLIKINEKPISSKKDYPSTVKLREEMKINAFIKPDSFTHEKEWRLLVWQKWPLVGTEKIFFKVRNEELCPYFEIPIPVSCLERIILQPNANEQMIEATQLFRAIYGGAGNNITVNKAKNTLKA